MGRRVQPTLAQMMELMRHLADVAAMKTDPAMQRQVLIDGLSRLFHAKLGWFFAVDDWRPDRRPKVTHQVLTSQPDAAWLRYMADFAVNHPPEADPYSDNSIRCDDAEQQWTMARVMPDLAAVRSYGPCSDLMRRMGVVDGMVCAHRAAENGDRVVGFALHRDKSDHSLAAGELALARLAVREVHDLYRRGHLGLRDVEPSLPPRLQQVLDRLLSGQNPKRMAREMCLSLHTVREHLDRLYKHYKVHGRDELAARFVRGGVVK